MDTDKPDAAKIASHDRVLIETGPQDVRVLRTRLRNLEDLTIMDDEDLGGDPYNSTGQYVTLGSRDR